MKYQPYRIENKSEIAINKILIDMFVSFIWAKGGQTLKLRRYKIADEL